ncbi:alpha/beta hydrolase [Salipaludibacillus daqingensis]|uniref:alpha/beta hydrolase n=1 Tax=Salipaludibacillus daqingensis TaxID=3041001 RepID=UPI0024761D55|nr:alpha/beta hydrolase [Salipaludibacillus daqingensis]
MQIRLTKLQKIQSWVKRRALKTSAYDSKVKMMVLALWLMTLFAVFNAGVATPTGFGVLIDLLIYTLVNTLLFFSVTGLVGFLLSLMYLPIPRLFVGSLSYTIYLHYYILSEANLGTTFTWIITSVAILLAICIGMLFTIMKSKHWSSSKKIGWSAFPLLIILFVIFWSPEIDNVEVENSFSEEEYITPLSVDNPAEKGDYLVETFTYGNGTDNHRDEFRNHVDVLSGSVDASDVMNEWEWFRKFFWGFDETELPLNGRVWMPEGNEVFPLVLMVHGNHRMENFSDAGYDYLGELLASRGYIAISVDQNFLNYSNWTGIPNDDYRFRAWMMLQHLLKIDDFNNDPTTPFYSKVDLQRVAVMGHSRGGQAAAMVADYERWFADDDSVKGMEAINVQAAIGVAPTDRQVDDMRPEFDGASYLTIHGARDGDVHNYHGDRQYSRVTVANDSDHFKAGVYIADANHSQFNKDWGRMDMRLPGGMFLNRDQMMDPEEQREVAKVYISAFIESTLGGNDQYIPLFRDVRYGSEWLPNTQYVTRFENNQFHPLVNFNSAKSKTELSQGILAEGIGFDVWEIESSINRSGNTKRKKGMVFEWENSGTYSLFIPDGYGESQLTDDVESVFLSIANMEGQFDEEEKEVDVPTNPLLDVKLETTDGESARVSLETFKEIAPAIHTQFTINRYFEDLMRDGKYSEATEPVFQSHEIPFASFQEVNPNIELENLERITLYFSSDKGKVMVDEIGFMKSKNE